MQNAFVHVKEKVTHEKYIHYTLEVFDFAKQAPQLSLGDVAIVEYDEKRTVVPHNTNSLIDAHAAIVALNSYINSRNPAKTEQGQQEKAPVLHERKFILSQPKDDFNFHCMCGATLSECPIMQEFLSMPCGLQIERNNDGDEQITATLRNEIDLNRYNSICIGCSKDKQR